MTGQSIPIVQIPDGHSAPLVPAGAKSLTVCTIHGPARVYWDWDPPAQRDGEVVRGPSYKPRSVENAQFVGGARCNAEEWAYSWRRQAVPPRLGIWGRAEISTDNVLFSDYDKQPTFHINPSYHTELEQDLAGCAEFNRALQNDNFAFVAYEVLKKAKCLKVTNPEISGYCGWRSIASVVAGILAKGEDYIYPYSGNLNPPMSDAERRAHVQRVEDIFGALGWRMSSK